MRIAIVASLLACTSVRASSDASPFLLFSTAKLAAPENPSQLQTGAAVLSTARDLLSGCPTTRYFLVSQPGAHAFDVRSEGAGCRMPHLCRAVAHGGVGTRFSVAAVAGRVAAEDLAGDIRRLCRGAGKTAEVEEVRLKALPPVRQREKRTDAVVDNDYEIGRLLEAPQAEGDYTVLFFSDPNELGAYEAEFTEHIGMELKRQSGPVLIGQRTANGTANLPLFEKYQFFTPGIFMGLMAMFFMLAILYVGLKALSSLEVSYGAFDKEMGPAAQKKQM